MTTAEEVLAATHTVLAIDWPTVDVPEALARAGFNVVVHGGPGPEDYTAYEVEGDEVAARHVGRPPEHAELVYSHRPLDELGEIIAAAQAVGARALWVQSGLGPDGAKDPTGCWLPEAEAAAAREAVEAAGLVYLDQPYIGDAARNHQASGR